MWKKLRGKPCKIVMKDGNNVRIYFGTVVHANDSFVVEKDRFGRIHFLNTSSIEGINEHSSAHIHCSKCGKTITT